MNLHKKSNGVSLKKPSKTDAFSKGSVKLNSITISCYSQDLRKIRDQGKKFFQ